MTTFLFYEALYFDLENRESGTTRHFYGKLLENAVAVSDGEWEWACGVWDSF